MGFTTSVENQTAFIIPSNDITRGIDYGYRFMITDNTIHPKPYEVTKIMDTFPLGTTKVTLKQTHYNEHTDLCGPDENFFGDEDVHMICNYYQSQVRPSPNKIFSPISWTLSEVNDKLYVHGQPQVIYAIPNQYIETNPSCEWHISIDGQSYKFEELVDYLNISIDSTNNTLTIAAINKDLANYIVSIQIYDESKSYYDFVEMEVSI